MDFHSLPFYIFFGLALLAIWRPYSLASRRLFLGAFFAILVGCGVAGSICWPFVTWHLYAFQAPEELDIYEVRVADAAGREIRFDAEACPPAIASPFRKWVAAKLPAWSPEQQAEMSQFLLRKANERKRELEAGHSSPWSYVKFPKHQFGYTWNAEQLRGLGEFTRVQVHKVHVRFSDDGLHVLDRDESVAWSGSGADDVEILAEGGRHVR